MQHSHIHTSLVFLFRPSRVGRTDYRVGLADVILCYNLLYFLRHSRFLALTRLDVHPYL